MHVKPSDGAPSAANRIECPIGTLGKQNGFGKTLLCQFRCLGNFVMGICLKPQPAERQGNARADIVALHIDKFQASATHIAHDPISMMKPGNDGERGAVGFLSAAQHFDVATQCFTNFLQKLRAVFGFTGRGGRDHFQLAHLHLLAQNAKPPHRRQCLIDAVIVQQPGLGNAAAQTAQNFFVEKY